MQKNWIDDHDFLRQAIEAHSEELADECQKMDKNKLFRHSTLVRINRDTAPQGQILAAQFLQMLGASKNDFRKRARRMLGRWVDGQPERHCWWPRGKYDPHINNLMCIKCDSKHRPKTFWPFAWISYQQNKCFVYLDWPLYTNLRMQENSPKQEEWHQVNSGKQFFRKCFKFSLNYFTI